MILVQKYTVVLVTENSFIAASCNCSNAYHAWTGTINGPFLTQLELSTK